jgi:hypothetical protein
MKIVNNIFRIFVSVDRFINLKQKLYKRLISLFNSLGVQILYGYRSRVYTFHSLAPDSYGHLFILPSMLSLPPLHICHFVTEEL